MNGPTGICALRTERPSFAAVSIASKYDADRDVDALDQLTLRVTGSTCSGQFVTVRVL